MLMPLRCHSIFFWYLSLINTMLYSYSTKHHRLLNMQNKTILSILAIVVAIGLFAAATVSVSESAFAAGGPKAEKNHGQCKQSFNDNPCKKFHTGGG